MRLSVVCCVVLLLGLAVPARAGQKSITLYLDGARVEQEMAATDGYLECPLPDSFVPGSLRVRPPPGGSVLRVELVPADRDRRRAREIARLEERISELQDRMQALARQEEIFSAAVKSQSGKAPRKTKANPDPVSSLQRGTDFALSQLESVYRGKRKCRRSLDLLEQELAAARKGVAVARVWLSGNRARLSFLTAGERWTPSYDFRFSGTGQGSELLLHARLPVPEKGVQYLVSSGTVAQGVPPRPVRGDFPTLGRYPISLAGTALSEPPRSFSLAEVEAGLPAGEAAAFWRGEYLGSGRYGGAGSREFSLTP